MRIFKNRGDIYMPSTKFKSDLEQKILLGILAFIIFFTAVFLLVFGIKYNFSAKEFFAPNDMKTEQADVADQLPAVSGKTNFLLVLSNKSTDEMLLCAIFQADMDTVSYKACTLAPNTQTESGKLAEIYKSSGAAGVVNSVNKLIGIDIDYYIDESYEDYKKMFDSMGSVTYTVLNDVKYKDTDKYGYNIKIKAGDQKIDGDNAEKLLRYYVTQEKNFSAANDLLLSAASQHMNDTNFENRESLFSKMIEISKTNITVKDFTDNLNNLKVLSSSTTGVSVYSAAAQYDGDELTSSSIGDILGYFAK